MAESDRTDLHWRSHGLRPRLRAIYHWAARLPLPCRLPWGAWWLGRGDVVSGCIRRGEPYEPGEQLFLRRFLEPGMTVVDVGAHQGFYTLLASKLVGHGGRVLAIEPSPREFRRLRWHLAVNRCRNVQVRHVAIAGHEGEATLFVCLGRETGCNSLRPPAAEDPIETVRVPVVTLDSCAEQAGIRRVDLIKMDVEGAELAALSGSKRLLTSIRPVLLCELADVRTAPWGYSSVDIFDFVAAQGYCWFSVGIDGRLIECPKKEKFHENLIAIPESECERIVRQISREGRE